MVMHISVALLKSLLKDLYSPLSLLGWIVLLLKPIGWGLRMLGDYDLFKIYGGSVGKFLETGWGTLVSVALGAAIIGFAIYRRVHIQIEASASVPPILRGQPASEPPQSQSSPISSETTGSLDHHWQFDSQMADAIAARLRSRPEWQGKIIVDVTPEYLWNLFRERRTTRQGNKDAERFLNRWMVVCGPFGDVSSPIGDQILVTFTSRAVFTIVLMYFNKEWGDQLELIMPDKKIAVVGRIESVNSNTLKLEDCELVQ